MRLLREVWENFRNFFSRLGFSICETPIFCASLSSQSGLVFGKGRQGKRGRGLAGARLGMPTSEILFDNLI